MRRAHREFKTVSPQEKETGCRLLLYQEDPGQCGEIQLSPMRIVAPVNGEVLLLAGICGKDGYLLKRGTARVDVGTWQRRTVHRSGR